LAGAWQHPGSLWQRVGNLWQDCGKLWQGFGKFWPDRVIGLVSIRYVVFSTFLAGFSAEFFFFPDRIHKMNRIEDFKDSVHPEDW
jgi:hypothetical protein